MNFLFLIVYFNLAGGYFLRVENIFFLRKSIYHEFGLGNFGIVSLNEGRTSLKINWLKMALKVKPTFDLKIAFLSFQDINVKFNS